MMYKYLQLLATKILPFLEVLGHGERSKHTEGLEEGKVWESVR